jgi:hypothetical protein
VKDINDNDENLTENKNIITEKTDTIEIEEFNECFNMLTSIEDV